MADLDNQSKNKLSATRLDKAFEAACLYYYSRLEDGSLDLQKTVAEKHDLDPPRFGEALKDAWKAGIVDVVINPPEHAPDFAKVRELEAQVRAKLEKVSPIVTNRLGLKTPKLKRVHIVPNPTGMFQDKIPEKYKEYDLFHSNRARVCHRAAREFFKLIDEMYIKRGRGSFYVGISWGRTCECVLNLMSVPSNKPYKDVVACPLIGIIGHRNAPVDANTLAYRLGAALSGDSIKLPAPCLRPLDLVDMDKVEQISKALAEVNQCQLGISGVAPAYNENEEFKSSLVARKMITHKELERIRDLGAVAEIHSHFFYPNGDPVEHEDLGFVPMSVSINRMKKMERFMIVVRPEKEKLLPAIVSVKAGICSDLVLDHRNAHYILDKKNNKELGLS